jgi:N-acyl-D-aspartate/D-glutamate deacylase
MDWPARARVWLDERTVLGASDAGAHLDMFCGGIFTTSFLAGAVRHRGLLSLEEGIRQLTDVPARMIGLTNRGRVEPGMFADLVLFDPATVAPNPTRLETDLPGGAARLTADATGIEMVAVNGTVTVEGGRLSGATPGTVLRSGRDTT